MILSPLLQRLPLLAPLILAACVATPRPPEAAPTPAFDPFAFFVGTSHGEATLRKVFSGAVPVAVRSAGRMEGDTLVLDQTIREGDKPPRTRQWRIRQVGQGRYTGRLSDASGPVVMETQGNRLHIAFAMKGGFPTEQWLLLAADGNSARNILIVRKLGFTLARLDERIVRD